MGVRKRRCGWSPAERTELWSRWRRGESFAEIAAALDRVPLTIWFRVREAGGVAERPRKRAPRALSAGEREAISRGLAGGMSLRAIGRELGRPASTISREVERNGGAVTYRSVVADKAAWKRAERPKRCKLSQNRWLRGQVARKLQLHWSPEQIAGWLRRTYPSEAARYVSHETIYRTLFIQARGALKRELTAYLRTQRAERGRRKRPAERRGQLIDPISIRERPPEVEDRAIPGHWEGDLISGSHNGSHIATLAERASRFVLLVKLTSKDAEHVSRQLQRKISKLPKDLQKTLTWDRGKEMAAHRAFTVATNIQVYFCDPRSPWQRGTNENTNGLLRQYFPKSMDLSNLTQQQLDKVAKELNNRPRQTLDFMSPAEKLQEMLR